MSRSTMAISLALLALSGARVPLLAADLMARIDELLDTPAVQRGFIGLQIIDLDGGKVLYEDNASRLFVPASNTKLFTTAMGLMRLGPMFRFQTTVVSSAAPDDAGRIRGALTLVGGGDPSLSGRSIPYKAGSPGGNPLAAIEDLADQVAGHGVTRIDGGIVGDDTAFVWRPYAEGWSMDDAVNQFGAPVSALAIHDNVIALNVRAGDPPSISLIPSIDYYQIDNRVRPGTKKEIHIEREPGSRQLRVWGTMPAKDRGDTHFLAIDDPALYGAMALQDALTRRGITVRGQLEARHAFGGQPMTPPDGLELARRTSAPLIEHLRVADKVSQNLYAEIILRAVSRERRKGASGEGGLAELQGFLAGIGIPKTDYRFHDGSGLSSMNLVTPAVIVKLLRYMYASRYREAWLSLLAVGGEDGTLRRRFSKTAGVGKIRAKTGTLSHAIALSGYAESSDGRMRAFSI
ncbi:MAG: D-alanyl-D-alanine carboxypeptidase/D-alanyl-D-alanine-endopeptidase, partial [Bryobacteraceae bacterium]